VLPHTIEGKFSRPGNRFLRTTRKYFSREAWFAACVAGWVCLLPILLRIYSLSTLLQRLAPDRVRERKNATVKMEQVAIVVRVCNLRLFRWPIFPRACLRQSLTLYRTLTRMGYPSEIHFGIRKDGAELRGHSWVTLQGKPVADSAQSGMFKVVYSYPSAPSPLPSPDGPDGRGRERIRNRLMSKRRRITA